MKHKKKDTFSIASQIRWLRLLQSLAGSKKVKMKFNNIIESLYNVQRSNK